MTSASESNSYNAYYLYMYDDNENVFYYDDSKNFFYSVRCLKD